jgi:3-oxoacyl-[acyl-carrier protein] reductase
VSTTSAAGAGLPGSDGAELPGDPLAAFRLPGRVAIVTGAAGGVGRGCAEILAAAGATVVCADQNACGETVSIITARGGTACGRTVDVSRQAEVEALVSAVLADHGRLDVMVNNAGIQATFGALEVPEEQFDRILAVNLKGVYFGCRAAGQVMAAAGRGSIVNIASEAIDRISAGVLPYAAAKAGVRQLTRNLALELGPQQVRVNAIAPGWMLTPLTRQLNPGAGGSTRSLEERMRSRQAMYPLGRTGTAADVAYATLYLASDASSWMTGQALRLNGGGAMPW